MKTILLLSSILVTYAALFFFGQVGAVRAFGNSASFMLLVAQIVLSVTMVGAVYYCLNILFHTGRGKIRLVVLALCSFVFSLFLITRSNSGVAVGTSYFLVGNYLRDVQDINIFFMDWGGWAMAAICYLTAVLTVALHKLLKREY